MDKCLEKKIYDRQIKKQGMSDRVVDECNPDAHLSIRDITNLCHDYDDDDKSQSEIPEFTTPLDSFEDVLIRKIVEQHKGGLSKEPFFHESLLIDRKEKKLSQAEKRQAHRGYEMEKKASVKQNFSVPIKNQYRIVRNDGSIVTRPVASVNKQCKKFTGLIRDCKKYFKYHKFFANFYRYDQCKQLKQQRRPKVVVYVPPAGYQLRYGNGKA